MIAADLEAHGPGAPFDHAVAELLAGTIRVARHAIAIAAAGAQLVEQRRHVLLLRQHDSEKVG
jgi:hypothetical protein